MLLYLTLAFFIAKECVAWGPLNVTPESTELPYVLAKVDNFDPNNKETYKQYYYVRAKGTSNVHILYIGGEDQNYFGETDSTVASYPTLVADLVAEFDASAYALEHRYYQNSYPVKYPRTAKDYRYHSSQQALADLDNFIKTKNKELKNPKWIAIGGSYPGMLALWFRMLYPNSTVGAIGSSAPVQAVLNFTSFMSISQQGYERQSPQCAAVLKEGIRRFNDLIQKANDGERSAISRLKDLYPRYSTHIERNKITRNYFAYKVISDVYTQIQMLIEGICIRYPRPNEDPLEYLAQRFRDCADDIGNVHWRSWAWQVCNEFGFFYSPDFENSYAKGSFDIAGVYQRNFGQQYTMSQIEKNVENTLAYYGGNLYYNATNVIISNSQYDPWRGQGVYTPTQSSAKTFFIRNGTHCHDLGVGHNSDVEKYRTEYKNLVKKWLQD